MLGGLWLNLIIASDGISASQRQEDDGNYMQWLKCKLYRWCLLHAMSKQIRLRFLDFEFTKACMR